VRAAVPSLQAAELLTLLQADPERWWELAELQARLRTAGLPDAEATRLLQLVEARGLLATGADRRLQFRPADPALAAHMRTLARAYKERPVTLIRMIYALRDQRIRSFADAFRLKGSKK
jgi:DNA-binding IclR family transcriptional regulator